jgi:hypothetical protein
MTNFFVVSLFSSTDLVGLYQNTLPPLPKLSSKSNTDSDSTAPNLKLHNIRSKGKGVPLHAMEAPGGRGGIAPTHSQPGH